MWGRLVKIYSDPLDIVFPHFSLVNCRAGYFKNRVTPLTKFLLVSHWSIVGTQLPMR